MVTGTDMKALKTVVREDGRNHHGIGTVKRSER